MPIGPPVYMDYSMFCSPPLIIDSHPSLLLLIFCVVFVSIFVYFVDYLMSEFTHLDYWPSGKLLIPLKVRESAQK